MNNTEEKEYGWWGSNLPGRKCDGTYELYSIDYLPPIKINKLFSDIKTIDDVKDNLPLLNRTIHSPTACYFDTDCDKKNNVFYVDQQGCVIWHLLPNGEVASLQDGVIVANSLPEFLSRLQMENNIWNKIPTVSMTFFTTPSPTDEQLSTLTPDEMEYVNFYLK